MKSAEEKEPDWSEFWSLHSPLKLLFWKIYEKYRVSAYNRLLEKTSMKGKTIAELGGGSGYLLGMVSKRKKAKAFVIDNNKKAFKFFKKTGMKLGVKFILSDMFAQRKKYDAVMSDGLIEHFHSKERSKVIALHRKLMKKGGVCIIFVPKNTWLVRNAFALKGGYEKKFFSDELKGEAEKAGLKVINSVSDIHMTGILCRK